MNCIQLYGHIKHRFPGDSVKFCYFVNPKLNHDHFLNVQFVYPSGAIHPPWNAKADDIHIADPLAGPFYTLPLVGLIFVNTGKGGWHRARAVVESNRDDSCRPNEKALMVSASILIRGEADKVREELRRIIGNNWYVLDQNRRPVPEKNELV